MISMIVSQSLAETGLTVSVLTSFEDAHITRDEWDQVVLNVGGDLYMTYDWCQIWWHHYGQGRELRLFIFRQGGAIVGLAPMFIERIWLGLVSLKLAKRVGADFALTIFSLPLTVDYAEIAYKELITRLIEGDRCDAVWFGFMPGNDATAGSLRHACHSLRGIVTVARDTAVGPHTVFRLPDSFELYLGGLDGRQRQNYRRRLKLFNKSFNVRSDVVSSPQEATAAFANFVSLHTVQWKTKGKPGHFGDWPGSEAFNTDLVDRLSRLGRFRLARIFADEQIISYQYAFVFGRNCYWRLPARVMENNWDRFGLGILGMLQLIELMILEHLQCVEAGVGHYDHKLHFNGQELQYRSCVVRRTQFGAMLRTSLFLMLSDLLHLVYYRVWRLRIAPHMAFRATPLWSTWIRATHRQ